MKGTDYLELAKLIKPWFEIYAVGTAFTIFIFEDGKKQPTAYTGIAHFKDLIDVLWRMTEELDLINWVENPMMVKNLYGSIKCIGKMIADNEGIYFTR